MHSTFQQNSPHNFHITSSTFASLKNAAMFIRARLSAPIAVNRQTFSQTNLNKNSTKYQISRLALACIRQMNRVNSRNDLCHDDSTINIGHVLWLLLLLLLLLTVSYLDAVFYQVTKSQWIISTVQLSTRSLNMLRLIHVARHVAPPINNRHQLTSHHKLFAFEVSNSVATEQLWTEKCTCACNDNRFLTYFLCVSMWTSTLLTKNCKRLTSDNLIHSIMAYLAYNGFLRSMRYINSFIHRHRIAVAPRLRSAADVCKKLMHQLPS